jgi:hypothetical protein
LDKTTTEISNGMLLKMTFSSFTTFVEKTTFWSSSLSCALKWKHTRKLFAEAEA